MLQLLTILIDIATAQTCSTTLYDWVSLLLVPVSSAITWYVTWRTTKNKRTNDAIATLQETVNNVLTENAKLYKEITANRAEIAAVRQENAGLKSQLDQVLAENERYSKEIAGLRSEIKRIRTNKS